MQMIDNFLAKQNLYFIFSAPPSPHCPENVLAPLAVSLIVITGTVVKIRVACIDAKPFRIYNFGSMSRRRRLKKKKLLTVPLIF